MCTCAERLKDYFARLYIVNYIDRMDLTLENIGCAKDNMKSPIHNWYKFTAGFSYKFVEEILKDVPKDAIIYEPFAGCGTTLVSAQKCGYMAIGNEGQELMYDICRAKLNWSVEQSKVKEHLEQIESILSEGIQTYDVSAENTLLQELYDSYNLKVLCLIRNYILKIADNTYQLFFKLALSNVLHKTAIYPIAVPYISRNKRLMNNGQPYEKFKTTCLNMVNDINLQSRSFTKAVVYLHDSREINNSIDSDTCSLCITSPPYLNNLDYGEVSKVHTHFWGITNSWNDITQKVRSQLVTGATTHYKDAEFDIDDFMQTDFALHNENIVPELTRMYEEIKKNAKERAGKKSFHILMMHYFDDMYRVLLEMRRVLRAQSKAYLILGDSAPYGVYVPTTQILGDIALSAGFDEYAIYKIRSRGTKWKSLSNRHNIELSENILVLS